MATWVISTISATAYWGIVCLMVIENVFPPIPSEVIMPLAGFMDTQDCLAWLGVILAGTLGSVLGALPLYYLGRKIGDERLKRLADRHSRWLTVSREDWIKPRRGLIAMAVWPCSSVGWYRAFDPSSPFPQALRPCRSHPFSFSPPLAQGSGRPYSHLRATGWAQIFGRWKPISIPSPMSCWRLLSPSMSGGS